MALLLQCLLELRAKRREFALAPNAHSEVLEPEMVMDSETGMLLIGRPAIALRTFEDQSAAVVDPRASPSVVD